MAYDDSSRDSYVDVAERIAEFRDKHPDGSLQPADPSKPFEVRQIEGTGKDGKPYAATFIAYTAAAYRTPDDTRPGIGVAWEVFPGRTPYTLRSELQNAETSAWGRAIVAALAADSKRGIASSEEVRNRAAERDDDWRNQPPVQGHNGRVVEDTPDVSHWEVQPGDTDTEWLAEIRAEIKGLKDKDYAGVLWRRVHEKTEAGGCTARDGKMLQESITERINAITKQPAKTLHAVGNDPT